MSFDEIFEATKKLGNDLLLLGLISLILASQHGFLATGYNYILTTLASATKLIATSCLAFVGMKVTALVSAGSVFIGAIQKSLIFSGLAFATNKLGSLIFAALVFAEGILGSLIRYGLALSEVKPRPLVFSPLENTRAQLKLFISFAPAFAIAGLESLRRSVSQLSRNLTTTVEMYTENAKAALKSVLLAVLIKTLSDWYMSSLSLETLLETSDGLGHTAIWICGTIFETTLNLIAYLGSSTILLLLVMGFYTFFSTTSNRKRSLEEEQAIAFASAVYDKSSKKEDDTRPEMSIEDKYHISQKLQRIHSQMMEDSLNSRNTELQKAKKANRSLEERVAAWMSRCEELRQQICINAAAHENERHEIQVQVIKRDYALDDKNSEIRHLEDALEKAKEEVRTAKDETMNNALACIDHVDGERLDNCQEALDQANKHFQEYTTLCKELHTTKEGAINLVKKAVGQVQAVKDKEILAAKKETHKLNDAVAELRKLLGPSEEENLNL